MNTADIKSTIKLDELLKETKGKYVNECKNSFGDKIRGLFVKERALHYELKKAKEQVTKIETRLKETQGKLTAIEAGNWSVLDNLKED